MILECHDSFENLIDKYTKLISIEKNDLSFLYKGKNIMQNKNILNRIKKKNIKLQ